MVTCASSKEARSISESLLKKRLVACASVVSGVNSRFWWKGRIDSAKECLVLLKSKKENFVKIEKEIKRIHSYEVPEIIAIPVIAGSRDYLKWVEGAINSKSQEPNFK